MEVPEDEICNNQTIPRGGPIYVANLVGPLTRIPHFEAAVVHELQNLEEELASVSSPMSEEDILVDELKIYTEEELFDMALKSEMLEDNSDKFENIPQPVAGNSSISVAGLLGKDDDRSVSDKGGNALALVECPEVSPTATTMNGTFSKINSRKRRKRKANSCGAESSSLAKVAKIVKIKQKQDQDKASVKLHSFNARSKTDGLIPSSDGVERMNTLRSTNSAVKVKSLGSGEHVAVRYPEVVLSVEVYHNIRKGVKTQEFLVLGRQTLTELRDKIYCLTDQLMLKAGQHDSSGYFLIEDVFCNDMREPSAVDYSEPILDWLRNSEDEAFKKWECIISGDLQQKQKAIVGDVPVSHLPRFRDVDMHNIRFCDLQFRLGAGYLYCHQGDCKHSIVIRDMRLIHLEDVHDRTAYPIITFQLKFRVQKCNVCKIYRATKVTVDDKWAQENPCYFCEDCYFLIHYSKDGILLYNDFSMYEYLHD